MRTLICLALMLTAFGPVSAIDISGIASTGQGGGSTDPYWKVVAVADNASFLAQQALILDPPLPGVWTPNTPTSKWVSVNAAGGQVLVGLPPGNYVYETEFTADATGSYTFNFSAAADNQASFYVNGTLDTTDVNKPTITGGTLIGNAPLNTFSLSAITGTANVNAGLNRLYAVVTNSTGTPSNTATGLMVQGVTVPEPSTYALAAIATGALGLMARRKARGVQL